MKYLSTKILIFALLVIAVLSGYNYFKKPFLQRFSQLEQQVNSTISSTQNPIQVAADALSPRAKILQLISFPVVLGDDEASVSAQLAWVQANQPGFVTLFGSNLSAAEVSAFVGEATQSAQATQTYYAPLIAVDHEGGVVQRLRGTGFTRLPSWRQECQKASADRQALFAKSAAQLHQAGVRIVFAPVLDVAQPGSFMGARACLTQDDAITTASDYILSFAKNGILPVVKHFPGIGSITNDLHFQLDTVDLQSQDTAPFSMILSAFPNVGVMTTHVAVAGKTNGLPCSVSALCLDVFPKSFPDVLLFTDALEMGSAGLVEGQTVPKALPVVATEAVTAGNNVLVFGEKVDAPTIEEIVSALEAKYAADQTFAKQVNDSVMKILKLKLPQEKG